MQKRFTVTGLGLKIDRVMVMPGSDLILSADPPSHWQRFGHVEGSVSERVFHVATPKDEGEQDDELEALRARYKDVTGSTPDGRWGAERIRQALEQTE